MSRAVNVHVRIEKVRNGKVVSSQWDSITLNGPLASEVIIQECARDLASLCFLKINEDAGNTERIIFHPRKGE